MTNGENSEKGALKTNGEKSVLMTNIGEYTLKNIRNFIVAILLLSPSFTSCISGDEPKKPKQEFFHDTTTKNAHKKIIENVLERYYNDNDDYEILNSEIQGNIIKVFVDRDGDGKDDDYVDLELSDILSDKGTTTFIKSGVFVDLIITVKPDGKFFLTNIKEGGYNQKFLYDKFGNKISYFDQIKNNETRIHNILQPTKIIRDKDKYIFAAILSSRLMEQIEYKDYLEIFCKDNEASYIITLRPSNDDEYLGSIIKMKKSAKLQTEENDGSSEFRIFKIQDKDTNPTSSTQRVLFSTKRVVEVNFDGNIEDKFGESTNTQQHKTGKGNILAGGVEIGSNPKLLVGGAKGDVDVNGSETSRKSLSEKVEHTMYTLNKNNELELNGRNAYPSTDVFLKYYLTENQ